MHTDNGIGERAKPGVLNGSQPRNEIDGQRLPALELARPMDLEKVDTAHALPDRQARLLATTISFP